MIEEKRKMRKCSTEIVVIEEQPPKQEEEEEPIRKLLSLFNNLKFPFFNLKPKHPPLYQHKEEEVDATKLPKVVWFPKTQVVVPPPLEAQADPQESSYKTSNPVILWQVYALGAFFISRWAWARWNERKGQGRSPNDGEGRPSDDGPRSSDNE